MMVAAAGSVPSFPTSLSFWWQAGEAESAGLRNREDASALFLQRAVPSSLVGHSAAESKFPQYYPGWQGCAPWGQLGQAQLPISSGRCCLLPPPPSPALSPASSWSAAISSFFPLFPDLGNTQSGGNVSKWSGPLSCSC